jgi:hypothetical protein
MINPAFGSNGWQAAEKMLGALKPYCVQAPIRDKSHGNVWIGPMVCHSFYLFVTTRIDTT